MEEKIMVSVLCSTYNHEKFIRDAIEGVLRQKTNFSFELIIYDDASTDHTAQIIESYETRYPDIIHSIIQKENRFKEVGGSGNIETYLVPAMRGKYAALCEGDDYWTDESKLQRQVDFLENHPEYSMCIHNAVKVNYETGEERILNTFPTDGTYSQREQVIAGLGMNFPATASYMMRGFLLREKPDFFRLDYGIRQYCACKGKVYYFHKPMSVYRVGVKNSFMENTKQNQKFYNNYTVERIRFFEQFDEYTNGEFHDILEKKIVSDYFGYCISIDELNGIEKAKEKRLNLKKVKKGYRCLTTEYLKRAILDVEERTENLFIYGTSKLAILCKKQLEALGISVQGFVVSDDQMSQEEVEGGAVYTLSVALEQYQKCGFVLGIQPVNADVILNNLKKKGIDNYCMPYTM